MPSCHLSPHGRCSALVATGAPWQMLSRGMGRVQAWLGFTATMGQGELGLWIGQEGRQWAVTVGDPPPVGSCLACRQSQGPQMPLPPKPTRERPGIGAGSGPGGALPPSPSALCHPLQGEKNQGFDVLYHNVKHGQVSIKELADFVRER